MHVEKNVDRHELRSVEEPACREDCGAIVIPVYRLATRLALLAHWPEYMKVVHNWCRTITTGMAVPESTQHVMHSRRLGLWDAVRAA